MISNKVALIIFVTASEEYDETTAAAQYFLHMASQTGIPIISWNADNSGFTFSKPLSNFRILQMAPPITHQIRAMIALLKRYNWSRFGVVTSKMAGSKQFLKLVQDEIQLQDDRHSFKLEIVHHAEIEESNPGDSSSDQHIEHHLRALKNSEARIILLYSTATRVKSLFRVAEKLGLLSEKYLWIGTQSVKGAMTSALTPVQSGMLTVNFHTVSNAMFPPADDVLPMIIGLAPKLFGLALSKLSLNDSHVMASTSTCSFNASNVIWPLGEHIYDKMKSSFLKGNPYHAKDGLHSFFYLFTQDGTLRDSYLTISNLRTKRNKEAREPSYYWDKVGEFTNGELRMDDIEWPNGKTNPPQGTPDKFHVKIIHQH
uniref:Receptor ligand binding region domain-containing protein n=1 Tax=Ditylenchus dipsaci TaxID=166011 RepID=A0A915D7R8_9BILA